MPRIGDYYEPLFALYSKNCLVPGEELLEQGEKRIFSLFNRVNLKVVYEEEIKRHDPELKTFINLNRPQDLELLDQV